MYCKLSGAGPSEAPVLQTASVLPPQCRYKAWEAVTGGVLHACQQLSNRGVVYVQQTKRVRVQGQSGVSLQWD